VIYDPENYQQRDAEPEAPTNQLLLDRQQRLDWRLQFVTRLLSDMAPLLKTPTAA
jgi:hypothetical protein